MPTPFVKWLAAALLANAMLSTHAASLDEKEDKKLVDAIKKATKDGIAPDKIEAAVGTKATINTSRGKVDSDILERGGFSDDPLEKELFPRNSVRRKQSYTGCDPWKRKTRELLAYFGCRTTRAKFTTE